MNDKIRAQDELGSSSSVGQFHPLASCGGRLHFFPYLLGSLLLTGIIFVGSWSVGSSIFHWPDLGWLILGAGLIGSLAAFGFGLPLVRLKRELRRLSANLINQKSEPLVTAPRLITPILNKEILQLTAKLNEIRQILDEERQQDEKAWNQVQQREQEKGQFFHDINFELRAPLTAMMGQVQMLLDGHYGSLTEGQKEDLKPILSSAQQLWKLLDDIIDISLAQIGQLSLKREPVAIAELVRETVAAQQGVILRRNTPSKNQGPVQLRTQIEDNLPDLHVDRKRLQQVLQNLLANAVKFTPQGTITVRLNRQDEDWLSLEVEDTGVGISSVDLTRLFQRYNQVGARREQRQGTGLGLAICHQLVKMHGGEISATSELGSGTKFTVLLPVSPKPTTANLDEQSAGVTN